MLTSNEEHKIVQACQALGDMGFGVTKESVGI